MSNMLFAWPVSNWNTAIFGIIVENSCACKHTVDMWLQEGTNGEKVWGGEQTQMEMYWLDMEVQQEEEEDKRWRRSWTKVNLMVSSIRGLWGRWTAQKAVGQPEEESKTWPKNWRRRRRIHHGSEGGLTRSRWNSSTDELHVKQEIPKPRTRSWFDNLQEKIWTHGGELSFLSLTSFFKAHH